MYILKYGNIVEIGNILFCSGEGRPYNVHVLKRSICFYPIVWYGIVYNGILVQHSRVEYYLGWHGMGWDRIACYSIA